MDRVEKIGSGIRRIRRMCSDYEVSEHWVTTIFSRAVDPVENQVSPRVTGEVTGNVTDEVIRLLAALQGEMKRTEIQQALDLKHEDHFRDAYLTPALQAQYIEMTRPDKPTSRMQKYRLTDKGKLLVG